MGEVVNLRAARKAKARDADARTAEQNRARFGRTTAEKSRDADETARIAKLLEGSRRET